jgi:hypothetical protein
MNTTTLALAAAGLYFLTRPKSGTAQVSYEGEPTQVDPDAPITTTTPLDLYKVRDTAPMSTYYAIQGFPYPSDFRTAGGALMGKSYSALGVIALPAKVQASVEAMIKSYQMRQVHAAALKTADKDPKDVEVHVFLYDGIDANKTNMIPLGNGIYLRSFHRRDVVTGSTGGASVSVSGDGVSANVGGVNVGFKW